MTLSIDKLLAAGCETGRTPRVCRSRGGESCAFDGAAIVLVPIADAAHVVHGPITCAAISWEGRGVRSSAGSMHRRGFTSALCELDIVYGAEGKLLDTIREVAEREHPRAVFVYATCVSGLTGEDVGSVARQASAELRLPVVPVNAPGFIGPKNLGNRIAGEALLEHVIGTAEPPGGRVTPTSIALIGEYNVAGDLDLVEPLLRAAGIDVLARITGNATFEELRWAHRARLSVLVCSRALVNVAEGLRRAWGVPCIEASFFGATETAAALRRIAEGLEAASPEARGVRERIEAVIAGETERIREALSPYASLRGKRAVLYSGGVKSWSMVSALGDLGVEVVAVGTKKSSHEDEEKIGALLGAGAPLVENVSPAVIRRLMNEHGGDLLVAGGRNRYLAAKEGWPFVDVNQERHVAYAGFAGLANLARDLAHSVAFYERQATASAGGAPVPVAVVEHEARVSTIDPLAHPASLGAVIALQGVHGALPVIHGAQGCSFLEKVLLVGHLNEPVALGTTGLFTEQVVLGDTEGDEASMRSLAEASRPAVLALIGSALSHLRGDDLAATARSLSGAAPAVIAIDAPDYEGGLEDGYRAAVSALAGLARPAASAADARRVTVLACAHLSPADATELCEIVERFGLVPTMLPDPSALDGSRQDLGPLAEGGVTLARIAEVGAAAHTLVIGASLVPVARELAARFGTPYTALDAAAGLAATDRLVRSLSSLSGRPVCAALERQRRVLVDAMRDAHGLLAGVRAGIALEADHALQIAGVLDELGCRAACAVVPSAGPSAARIPADRVVVGDFASVPEGLDLLVSNSHAAATAARLGAGLLQVGFPSLTLVGSTHAMRIGYRGTTTLTNEIANLAHASRAAHHNGGGSSR